MATYTATAAQTGIQPKGLRVGLVAVDSVFSADGISTSIGTVVNMIRVPQGARVMYMAYSVAIAGEYTLQIGDSVNGARYRSPATYSAGLGTLSPLAIQMMNYTYSADDTLIMRISLASVLTLGGAYYMRVIFSMDPT